MELEFGEWSDLWSLLTREKTERGREGKGV